MAAGESVAPADAAPLTILHQDEDLVVIDKPAGLLVHRSPIDRHETRFAVQQLRDQIGHRVYPIHRLDKPTSGLLMFARSSAAAARFSQALAAPETIKRYLLVCRGTLAESGRIDHPLSRPVDFTPRKRAPSSAVNPSEADRLEALTEYRCLFHAELDVANGRYATSRYSVALAHLHSGRKHQIRRHFKHIAHPIIGDTTHGKSEHNRIFTRRYQVSRLLLHAASVVLKHPFSGDTLALVALPDAPMCHILDDLASHAGLTRHDWLQAAGLVGRGGKIPTGAVDLPVPQLTDDAVH